MNMDRIFFLKTLLAWFILLPFLAIATPFEGGDIQYECIGPHQFIFQANLYHDCSGTAVPTSLTLQFTSSCGTSFQQVLALQNPGGTNVSQLCASQLSSGTCNGGTLAGTEHYIYSDTVDFVTQTGLSNPTCNFWNASFTIAARPATINTIGGDLHIEARLNTVAAPCNNSPVFEIVPPVPTLCQDLQYGFTFETTDRDCDSLAYSFVSAKQDTNSALVYNTGFGPAAPIPGITIDPIKGELLITTTGLAIGAYTVVVQVDEYNAGTWIGSSIKDVAIKIDTCVNVMPDILPPFCSGGSNCNYLDTNTIEVCVGDLICLDFLVFDIDTGAGGFTNDSIALFSNATNILPGATFTASGSNPATATVCWTAQAGCDLSTFYIRALDEHCATPAFTNYPVRIKLFEPADAGPDIIICQGDSAHLGTSGTGNSFNWSVLSGEPINSSNFSCQTCIFPVASPSVTTTYIVTSSNPFCGNSDTVTVFVGTATLNNATSTPSTCPGTDDGTITIQASTTGTALEYTINSGNNYSTSNVFTNLSAGTYQVGIRDTTTGCADALFIPATVNQTPITTISINFNDTTIPCPKALTFMAAGAGGSGGPFTYHWTPDIGTGTVIDTTVDTTTTFSVFATDINGCASSPESFTVTVEATPIAITLSSDTIINRGDTITICGSATGGNPPYNSFWSNGLTDACQTIVPLINTTYTYTVGDSCQSTTASMTVTVWPVGLLENGNDAESFNIYPNPYSGSTTLEVQVPQSTTGSLIVRDVTGKVVQTLFEGAIDQGEHRFSFGANANGYAPGVYFAQLILGNEIWTKRLVETR